MEANETYEHRTMFFFQAEADDPHGWGLDFERFARSLDEGFPQANSVLQEAGSSRARLAVWAQTDDGVEFSGIASVAGRDSVLIEDNSAAEAARFAMWLRQEVVPAGQRIVVGSEAALDAGLEGAGWLLPDGADRAGVEEALRQHLAEVHDADVASAYEAARAEGARREDSGP